MNEMGIDEGADWKMKFLEVEKFCWPLVLLVGKRITSIDDSLKARFWRDHTIICGLIVLPATALDWLTTSIPVAVFPTLVTLGGVLYFAFIYEWRKYLNSLG